MGKKKITDILIVGVGGQGILLAGDVLSTVCLIAGNDVKQSEIHGMAQRGGSVSCHIRYGKKVYSPTIELGSADYLLSFELLEALRWKDYLSEKGIAIISNQRIDPITVASCIAKYPENIKETLQQEYKHLELVDAVAHAKQVGSIKAVNIILLGILSRYLKFDVQLWEKAISKSVPKRTLNINLNAFHKGLNITIKGTKNTAIDTTGE